MSEFEWTPARDRNLARWLAEGAPPAEIRLRFMLKVSTVEIRGRADRLGLNRNCVGGFTAPAREEIATVAPRGEILRPTLPRGWPWPKAKTALMEIGCVFIDGATGERCGVGDRQYCELHREKVAKIAARPLVTAGDGFGGRGRRKR